MDAGMSEEEDGDDAAQAFEALRAEVAALGEQVRELAGCMQGQRAPDYTLTLGKLVQQVEAAAADLAVIKRTPALQTRLQLSAEGLDRHLDELTATVKALEARLARQRGWRGLALRSLPVLAGAVLGAGALPMAARYAPASWGWDTGLATWVLGAEKRVAGGYRLLGWDADQVREVQTDVRLGSLYAPDLMLCEAQATVDDRAMTCNVAVRPVRP